MRSGVVWLGLSCAVLLACHAVTPEQEAREVCAVLCSCLEAPLPGPQATCVAACTAQLPTVTDACLDCTFTHEQACPVVIGQCVNTCVMRATP